MLVNGQEIKLYGRFEAVAMVPEKPSRHYWRMDDDNYDVHLKCQTWREWQGEKKNIQTFEVECIGETRDNAEATRPGEVVRVEGFIGGRDWTNKHGEALNFKSLKVTTFENLSRQAQPAAAPAPSAHVQAKANGYQPQAGEPLPWESNNGDDDIPF